MYEAITYTHTVYASRGTVNGEWHRVSSVLNGWQLYLQSGFEGAYLSTHPQSFISSNWRGVQDIRLCGSFTSQRQHHNIVRALSSNHWHKESLLAYDQCRCSQNIGAFAHMQSNGFVDGTCISVWISISLIWGIFFFMLAVCQIISFDFIKYLQLHTVLCTLDHAL